MGLGDFILVIDKLGVIGLIVTLICVFFMVMGSFVDLVQGFWLWKRWRKRQKQREYNSMKAQILFEMHEGKKKKND
jgi:UPF0716 family protein affecting phage T7 exclusion